MKETIFKKYKFPASSNFIKIRGMNFHYYQWGNKEKPTIVLIHGFLDHGFTFNWLAQELADQYNLIAWDARGFGFTDWIHSSGYYHFPDYIYDLKLFTEALNINRFALIGHSMGGMISLIYSSLFPNQVEKVFNLEGCFYSEPKGQFQHRFKQWLEDYQSNQGWKHFNSPEEALKRLKKYDHLMTDEQAKDLSELILKKENDQYFWRHDPLHRSKSPNPLTNDQLIDIWKNINQEILFFRGNDSKSVLFGGKKPDVFFKNSQLIDINNAGHNIHLHQPKLISKIVHNSLKAKK